MIGGLLLLLTVTQLVLPLRVTPCHTNRAVAMGCNPTMHPAGPGGRLGLATDAKGRLGAGTAERSTRRPAGFGRVARAKPSRMAKKPSVVGVFGGFLTILLARMRSFH